jgi:hypothetical protein
MKRNLVLISLCVASAAAAQPAGITNASVSGTVKDKDGNPVPAIRVLLMPANAVSEAVLQSVLVTGETDQTGLYTSDTLAPGKYYVAAVSEGFNATTESIDRMWRSRISFREVDLGPGNALQVSLEPLKIP